MDKKHIFNKGNKRCILFGYFKRHQLFLDKPKCIDDYGFCKNSLEKINCSILKNEIIRMIKERKPYNEIRKYINDNLI